MHGRPRLLPKPACVDSCTPAARGTLPPPSPSLHLAQARYQELETRKDGLKFLSQPMKASAQRLQQLAGAYEARQAELLAQARVWGCEGGSWGGCLAVRDVGCAAGRRGRRSCWRRCGAAGAAGARARWAGVAAGVAGGPGGAGRVGGLMEGGISSAMLGMPSRSRCRRPTLLRSPADPPSPPALPPGGERGSDLLRGVAPGERSAAGLPPCWAAALLGSLRWVGAPGCLHVLNKQSIECCVPLPHRAGGGHDC